MGCFPIFRTFFFQLRNSYQIKQEAALVDGSLLRCGTLSINEEGCRSATFRTTVRHFGNTSSQVG